MGLLRKMNGEGDVMMVTQSSLIRKERSVAFLQFSSSKKNDKESATSHKRNLTCSTFDLAPLQ